VWPSGDEGVVVELAESEELDLGDGTLTGRHSFVGSVVGGLEHVYDSPGQVEFELDGAVHRLTAFNGMTPGSLMVLFTDETPARS